MSVSLSLFPGQTVSDSIVRVQQTLAAMREGTPVILMDDFDRENEADLIIAAEKITDRTMALLIRECSGIVCLCLPDEALQRLKLPAMVDSNESRYGTAFTISIEARQGVTTGVSATDRVTTIRAAIADDAQPEHLARPGAAARDWRHFLGAARAVQPRRFQSSGIRLKALGSATLSGSRRVRDINRDCAY